MVYDYNVFKKNIFNLTSIDLNCYKERQMKRRIDALIAKHKVSSYEAYVSLIKKDRELFDEFINYLTINVSEFYRNPEQWELLEKEVLPFLFEKHGRQLKIWSAACSTGDEPYSMVMLLSKFMPLSNIKVIATDIDKQVLEKAQLGLYNAKSLKTLPLEFQSKYFTMINDRTYQISDKIKSRVEFKNHNLLKDEYPQGCHMIVCRNVLIYFTEEAKIDIYKKFAKSLHKDGILFVGSTEQILQPASVGYDSFRSFFYKKI